MPTFNMSRNDTIAQEATVLFIQIDGIRHVLSNRAAIGQKFKVAVQDEVADCVWRHFQDPAAEFICTIGEGQDPLFARQWRGHFFVWSFRSNMWAPMMTLSEAKQGIRLAAERGGRIEAPTEVGQAVVDSALLTSDGVHTAAYQEA